MAGAIPFPITIMNHPDFPQKYSKPFVDRYHPEKYRDNRFRRTKPIPSKYRTQHGNMIQPDV